MTSHERLVVSNHRSLHCLFNSLCEPTSKKHQSPHNWPFVRGIHRYPEQGARNAEKASIWLRLHDRSSHLARNYLCVIYCLSINASGKKLQNDFEYKTLTDFPKCRQSSPRLFMKRPSPPREPSNTNHRPCSLAFDPCGLGLPIPGFSLGNLQWRWYLNQHGWWMG